MNEIEIKKAVYQAPDCEIHQFHTPEVLFDQSVEDDETEPIIYKSFL